MHNTDNTYKFLPKEINLFPNGNSIILSIHIDKPTSPGHFVSVNAFDAGYDPWLYGSVPKNENETPFVKSLEYMNQYFLSGDLDYRLTYSRKVRKTIANSNLNLIGLGFSHGLWTNYNTQAYIESKMHVFPKNLTTDSNLLIKLEISPQSFIIEEYREQRSNTVISILGTIFGYCSAMMSLYLFAFRSDEITPEGLVEFKCRGFKKKTNDIQTFILNKSSVSLSSLE
ncbi:10800_t:CDS:2 [Entrophospora sp. SA101]|nr:10800_t:CDS:2 [Entrophospora sp. SA101]